MPQLLDEVRAEIARWEQMRTAVLEELKQLTRPLAREPFEHLLEVLHGALAESRRALERLEANRDLVAPEGLQGGQDIGTIGTMHVTAEPNWGAAVSAGKTRNPRLFQQKLHEANLSLPAWAKTKSKFKLKESRAQSWVKPGKGGRPVPRVWADRIAAEFNDPELAKSENWPHGIKD